MIERLVSLIKRAFTVGVVGCALLSAVFLPADALPVPISQALYMLGVYPMGMAVAVAAIGIIAVPVLVALAVGPLLRAERRQACAVRAAEFVAIGVSVYPSIVVWSWIEGCAWESVVNRAQPLIAAIESYRETHGRPPAELGSLVGQYIAHVPGTGLAGFPAFSYRVGTRESGPYSYELSVNTARGMGFDVFVYWPEKSYPKHMYGGFTRRIGDWAYVNE